MAIENRVVINHLRQMADALEQDQSSQIGDFDVGQRISGGIIAQDLRITVYHQPSAENMASVFGVDLPSTLEETPIT